MFLGASVCYRELIGSTSTAISTPSGSFRPFSTRCHSTLTRSCVGAQICRWNRQYPRSWFYLAHQVARQTERRCQMHPRDESRRIAKLWALAISRTSKKCLPPSFSSSPFRPCVRPRTLFIPSLPFQITDQSFSTPCFEPLGLVLLFQKSLYSQHAHALGLTLSQSLLPLPPLPPHLMFVFNMSVRYS